MSLPSQPKEESKTKVPGSDDAFYGQPHVILLNEKQWRYVQRHYHMSPRELEVAKLVCRGFRNGDMAEKLKVRTGTVKTHLRNIFAKVRARNKITLLLRFIAAANHLYSESDGTGPLPLYTLKPTQQQPEP